MNRSINKDRKKLLYLFIMQLVVAFLLYFSNYYTTSTTTIFFCNSTILLICVTTYYVLYRIIRNIMKSAQEEVKQEAIIKQKKIQEDHFKALEINRKHIMEMKDQILHKAMENDATFKKSNEEKRLYINSLVQDYRQFKHIDNCKNSVVDAILYNKALLAESKGISFTITALLPENLKIEHIDLMCLFSNLLDNAIDANQSVKESNRFIRLYAQIEANYLIVKVENAKQDNQSIALKKYQTSKKDKVSHGLGLSILQNTCHKYNGKLIINDKGNEVSIRALLSLS